RELPHLVPPHAFGKRFQKVKQQAIEGAERLPGRWPKRLRGRSERNSVRPVSVTRQRPYCSGSKRHASSNASNGPSSAETSKMAVSAAGSMWPFPGIGSVLVRWTEVQVL